MFKRIRRGCRCGSEVEHLPSVCKAVVPSPTQERKKRERKRERKKEEKEEKEQQQKASVSSHNETLETRFFPPTLNASETGQST